METQHTKVMDGNILKVWHLMVALHKEKPDAFLTPEKLEEEASKMWQSLKDKTRCPNCKASMMSHIFSVDIMIVALLVGMGNVVRENLKKGLSFQEANLVHVQRMQYGSYAVKSRTTMASKLGLIAKKMENGAHVPGTWLLTKRGFQALRNEPIPQEVVSFRGEIIERTEKETTIKEVMAKWKHKYEIRKEEDKKVGLNHTALIDQYHSFDDWVQFGTVQQGALF